MGTTKDRYDSGSGTSEIQPWGHDEEEVRAARSAPQYERFGYRSQEEFDRVNAPKTMPPAIEHNDEAAFEAASCPQCGGDGYVMGQLGSVVHHRCRNCGWTFS